MNPVDSGAGLALFSTAIGRCGIAWSGATILATHLPEESESATMERLIRRSGVTQQGQPTPEAREAIAGMTALLDGTRVDLGFVACDFSRINAFSANVYRVTRAILPGDTLTYGAIAVELGDKRLAQAVGHALGRNPWPIIVPCHRVLGAKGHLTGFSANGGTMTKLRMLEIEGAQLGQAPGLFDDLPLAVRPPQ